MKGGGERAAQVRRTRKKALERRERVPWPERQQGGSGVGRRLGTSLAECLSEPALQGSREGSWASVGGGGACGSLASNSAGGQQLAVWRWPVAYSLSAQ